MKRFFLSRYSEFPFKLFGTQHLIMIFITIILFALIYLFKDKIIKLDHKKSRVLISLLFLFNMFVYRGMYIYYGVYNIKVHLSLYYCHIVNYLFVFSLFLNYKPFYKIVYGLSWVGSIWTIFFPDVSGGIDCFIFYNSFICHNLLLVFTTMIISIKSIRLELKDIFKVLIYAIIIILFTYCVNLDFGTKFNTPHSILKQYLYISDKYNYFILIIMGIIGIVVGKVINNLYVKEKV